jgi:hypothetical protein
MKQNKQIFVVLLSLLFFFMLSCGKSKNPAGPENSKIYSISGKILENNVGLSGISLHVTGASIDTTITTSGDGTYFIDGIVNGAYTLTPSGTGYSFSPESLNISIESGNIIVPDFTATIAPAGLTYTLAGKILEGVSGLSGVSVHLVGAGKDTTATTISTGDFAFNGLLNGTYTITPTKTDYEFTPSSLQINVSNKNYLSSVISATKKPPPIIVIPNISFETIPAGTFLMGDELVSYEINSVFQTQNLGFKKRQGME